MRDKKVIEHDILEFIKSYHNLTNTWNKISSNDSNDSVVIIQYNYSNKFFYYIDSKTLIHEHYSSIKFENTNLTSNFNKFIRLRKLETITKLSINE